MRDRARSRAHPQLRIYVTRIVVRVCGAVGLFFFCNRILCISNTDYRLGARIGSVATDNGFDASASPPASRRSMQHMPGG